MGRSPTRDFRLNSPSQAWGFARQASPGFDSSESFLRQAVFAAFGPDDDMQLYGRGIRRRLAPMLQGDRRRLELAYSLTMALPGTPVLRYGDEMGMGDNLRLPECNCARTPMQWSTEPQRARRIYQE